MASGDKHDIVSQGMVKNDLTLGSPRLRVSLNAPLTLDNNWQTITFDNDKEVLDTNTFPIYNEVQRVCYNESTNLFKFNIEDDKNYTIQMYYKFGNGLRPIDILFRFVIPNSYMFPFPFETEPFLNLTSLERISEYRGEYSTTIYAEQNVRNEGLQLQMRVAQNYFIGGRVVLENLNFLILS
jgi:hypothetical protein